MADKHLHKCGFNPPPLDRMEAFLYPPKPTDGTHGEGCGHVFSHGDENLGDVEAHTCPSCGRGAWFIKYWKPGAGYHPSAREYDDASRS